MYDVLKFPIFFKFLKQISNKKIENSTMLLHLPKSLIKNAPIHTKPKIILMNYVWEIFVHESYLHSCTYFCLLVLILYWNATLLCRLYAFYFDS